MAIDTDKSIIDYIFARLTTDTSLKATMGGTVRLYREWAVPDAAFPYLVHRLEHIANDFYPICAARYYLDIWSDSPDSQETTSIRKRIIELLDEIEFSTTEADRAVFCMKINRFEPEAEQDIWHYAFEFNLDYFRNSEIDSIESR